MVAPEAMSRPAHGLSWKALPPRRPMKNAYSAQMMAATAVPAAKRLRGYPMSPHVSVTAVRPAGMKRQTMMSCTPYRASDRSAHARVACPRCDEKNRRSVAGPNRRPTRYDRLSPRNAPAAAQAINSAIRGSALPAVATPRAMTAVSLGRIGMSASSAGMRIAIRYERAESTCRLVKTPIQSGLPGCDHLLRRDRSSGIHRPSRTMPKKIHGAATIRSLPVISVVLCCRCRLETVHPAGVPAR